jgi:hypothetical protein
MHLLPRGNEIIKVFCCGLQNFLHVTAFGIRRRNSIFALGQRHRLVVEKIDNHFDPGIESVRVARLMVDRKETER